MLGGGSSLLRSLPKQTEKDAENASGEEALTTTETPVRQPGTMDVNVERQKGDFSLYSYLIRESGWAVFLFWLFTGCILALADCMPRESCCFALLHQSERELTHSCDRHFRSNMDDQCTAKQDVLHWLCNFEHCSRRIVGDLFFVGEPLFIASYTRAYFVFLYRLYYYKIAPRAQKRVHWNLLQTAMR